MKYIAQFDYPKEYKIILRDSFMDNIYYGLDEFDCKYLKIVQSKFGCLNSFHTIPERVKMEMAPFEWSEKKQKFVLNENKRQAIQLNQLEIMIVSHSLASV
jgi:hypothetical protein